MWLRYNNLLVRSIPFTLAFIVSTLVISQNQIDPKEFFDRGMSISNAMEKSLGENVEFPWIERIELRTETRDFDFDKQEYTFRVTPSTGKKRRAQKEIYEHLKNAPDYESMDNRCDLSLSVHSDWLRLYSTLEYIKLYSEFNEVISDKQTLIDRKMESQDFDFQEILKLEEAKTDVKLRLSKLELNKTIILEKYKIDQKDIVFPFFINIETISDRIENASIDVSTYDMEKSLYEIDHLSKEIALENAEKKQIFDFGQIKYQGPHTDLLDERISLGIGFLIPNSGNRKLKTLELELKQEELARRIKSKRDELSFNLQELRASIQKEIQIYFETQDIILKEKERLTELAILVSQKEGTSPKLLLDIHERNIKNKIRSFENLEDIFLSYLKFLNRSGQICSSQSLTLLSQK